MLRDLRKVYKKISAASLRFSKVEPHHKCFHRSKYPSTEICFVGFFFLFLFFFYEITTSEKMLTLIVH